MTLYSSSRKKKKSDRYPAPKTPLESLLYEHLDWLRVKHYSENTVTTRHNEIMWFLGWCAERDLTEPTEITRPILERYQRYLYYYRKKNGEPLSYRSQHARLVPLKVWFRWMTRQNYILHNPASELELPRIGHHLPKSAEGQRQFKDNSKKQSRCRDQFSSLSDRGVVCPRTADPRGDPANRVNFLAIASSDDLRTTLAFVLARVQHLSWPRISSRLQMAAKEKSAL